MLHFTPNHPIQFMLRVKRIMLVAHIRDNCYVVLFVYMLYKIVAHQLFLYTPAVFKPCKSNLASATMMSITPRLL